MCIQADMQDEVEIFPLSPLSLPLPPLPLSLSVSLSLMSTQWCSCLVYTWRAGAREFDILNALSAYLSVCLRFCSFVPVSVCLSLSLTLLLSIQWYSCPIYFWRGWTRGGCGHAQTRLGSCPSVSWCLEACDVGWDGQKETKSDKFFGKSIRAQP